MKIQQKKIAAPIPNFVFENNLPPYGVYHGKVADTNTNAWDGNKGWLSARRLQRKAWIYLGAFTKDLFVGFLIVDAGYSANASCYVYERATNTYWEKEYMRPFGFGKNFQAGLTDHWQLGPYQIWSEQGQWNFSYKHKKTELLLQFTEPHQGMSAICPSGKKRPFYHTYKNLLLPTSIYYKNDRKEYKTTQAMGHLDYSKGYPPHHIHWNWTSFMGKLDDGTPIGIHAVCGNNKELENAIWIGNIIERLGPMDYPSSTNPVEEHWVMKAKDDRLQLQLQPECIRHQDINFKLLKSSKRQLLGAIKGKLYRQDIWQNFEGYGIMDYQEVLW
ncbi:MAG: DUF2804 family protein [Aureispira sp.]